MSKRQKRSDTATANVVVRGINILGVRNPSVARHYMESRDVPPAVIERVLDASLSHRLPSAEQLVSEAITPLSSTPDDD